MLNPHPRSNSTYTSRPPYPHITPPRERSYKSPLQPQHFEILKSAEEWPVWSRQVLNHFRSIGYGVQLKDYGIEFLTDGVKQEEILNFLIQKVHEVNGFYKLLTVEREAPTPGDTSNRGRAAWYILKEHYEFVNRKMHDPTSDYMQPHNNYYSPPSPYNHRHPQQQKPQPHHRSTSDDNAIQKVHPQKKLAESETEPQKDIKPPPQCSLISKDSSPPKTAEFGPVSSLLAHSDGSVPSEIPAQPVRLREKFAENLTGPPNVMGPFPQCSLVSEGPDPLEKTEFGSVLSPMAHPHGPAPPEIVTIPAPPKEKFAEIQQSFQNDTGPFPQHPLDPEGPNEVYKSEIGSVLGIPAQSDDSVQSGFSDALSPSTSKFAENLTNNQIVVKPLLLSSLSIDRPTAVDKGEFGSLLSTHAQSDGLVPSEFSDALPLPASKFAENLMETQMVIGPILLTSLTPKGPKTPDKSEFGLILSSHAQFEGPVQYSQRSSSRKISSTFRSPCDLSTTFLGPWGTYHNFPS